MDNLTNKTIMLSEFAKIFEVTDNDKLYCAGEKLVSYKALIKEIEDSFKPIIEKAHQSHKEAIWQMNKHLTPVKNAMDLLKSKINAYTLEVRRQEQEAHRLAEAKAQEQARLEALAKASEAPEEFKEQVYEAVLETKQDDMPYIEQKNLNKELPKGVKIKTITRWKVVDYSQMNRNYTVPNEVMINAIVRKALKGAEQIIGGIEVFEEEEVR